MKTALGVLLSAALSGWVAWETAGAMSRHAAARRLRGAFDPSPSRFARVKRWLNRHALARSALRQFPDFLDLLALGVSAGMTLEASWSSALEALPQGPAKAPLAEFERALRWGRSRSDAFDAVRARLADPPLRMTISLIEQAMRHGVSLRDVLLDQARAIRQRRRLELEARVQTAGLKLLFPIFVFILPAVFLVLFAPLVIRLSHGDSFLN